MALRNFQLISHDAGNYEEKEFTGNYEGKEELLDNHRKLREIMAKSQEIRGCRLWGLIFHRFLKISTMKFSLK